MKQKTNYESGHFAEKIAIWYLRFKGYHLVARNFTVGRGTGAGEIDFILTKGNTIVFFEVKKRATLSLAAEAISIKNQMRTIKASAVFLQRHPRYNEYLMRYDAVLFERGKLWPHHITDAWRVL